MPSADTSLTLRANRLFDGESWREDYAVVIEQGTITALVPGREVESSGDVQRLTGGILAPGFIDLQVNGGGDCLVNNSPTAATLATIAAAHRASGTTGLMPTIISERPALLRTAVAAVHQAREQGEQGILGLHIEGPFLAPKRRGAHQAAMIRSPLAEDIDWLCTLREFPVMVTLAPEHCDDHIQRLSSAGLLVCAGHTEASFEQITAARAQGLRGFTHLFNAMSPLMGRAPGCVGAALDSDDCWVGIIADGHHVHPVNIRLAQRSLPVGKLCLVSDAMATVGGLSAQFDLYGETISAREGRLVNSEGVLAGSAIGMIDAVRYCALTVGLPLPECLRMASLYPAGFLGLEGHLGRIAPGYRANFLCFDDEFRVRDTWVAGVHQRH